MRKEINKIWHKVIVFLRLSPLSLAEKCRLAFGGTVALVLALALLLCYIWMNQLTKKALLDSVKAKAEMVQLSHFQLKRVGEAALPELDNTGSVQDVNDVQIQWIRFAKEEKGQLKGLTDLQRQMIKSLKSKEERLDEIIIEKTEGNLESNYVRIFRADDQCISCHNPEGSAGAFGRNEAIGAVVIRQAVGEIGRIILMNRICIIAAWLISGAGAIIAFYIITQRVILRPIRQLRALANNVAEGNLNIRSSIKTRDEYEKLANAFNHMLDGLQGGQQKLRRANIQLDEKIAELSERNIELFKANKVKGEFLANISHEFRTPLNAILGFAEILREKAGDLKEDKGRKYAENIIAGGKNLLNMVNDLLDLAKTEAGKMKLYIERCRLDNLCQAAIGAFSEMTKQKKIKVKLIIEKDIPSLTTDAGKVQQILYNFLSNAVKFTPEQGRIEVRASVIDDKHVRIAVSDTGCGVSQADRETIFEKFRQVDGSITRKTTGSGLGLSICKELAAMLAGSIGLKSEVGKGSTFWLDIPVTISKESEPTE